MNDFVCHILLCIGCMHLGIKGENVNLKAFLADYKIHDTWHTQYSSELLNRYETRLFSRLLLFPYVYTENYYIQSK
jgi:hypothetical protein